MSVFNAPDRRGTRFRLKTCNIVNNDFINRLRKEHPEIKLTNAEVKKLIKVSSDVTIDKVIEKRDGLQLPEQLGLLFIGSVPETKSKNIDYKKSIELNTVVRHKNYETDNMTAKIFYSTFGSAYTFKFNDLWAFKAERGFKLKVSKSYLTQFMKYIRVIAYNKINAQLRSRLKTTPPG